MSRSEIEQGLSKNFAGPMKGTEINISAEEPIFLKRDVAIGRGSYEIRRGTEVLVAGRYLSVWTKGAGGWRIRVNQAMVPAKAPAAGNN